MSNITHTITTLAPDINHLIYWQTKRFILTSNRSSFFIVTEPFLPYLFKIKFNSCIRKFRNNYYFCQEWLNKTAHALSWRSIVPRCLKTQEWSSRGRGGIIKRAGREDIFLWLLRMQPPALIDPFRWSTFDNNFTQKLTPYLIDHYLVLINPLPTDIHEYFTNCKIQCWTLYHLMIVNGPHQIYGLAINSFVLGNRYNMVKGLTLPLGNWSLLTPLPVMSQPNPLQLCNIHKRFWFINQPKCSQEILRLTP